MVDLHNVAGKRSAQQAVAGDGLQPCVNGDVNLNDSALLDDIGYAFSLDLLSQPLDTVV